MNERMSKARFLDMMQSARKRWVSLLAQIDEAEMERPGVTGRWSVRDIVAHVTGLRARAGKVVGSSQAWRIEDIHRFGSSGR